MTFPRSFVRALWITGITVSALVVSVAFVGATYQPNIGIPTGFAGRHLEVLGIPLRVLQQGHGPDVVLLHGSPGSIEDWAPVMSALASSCRLTAFDRPGHGYSSDAGEYSLEYNASATLALIDQLQLEHVIVVGHSYGGAAALATALRGPSAVDAYVIVDSAAYEPLRKPDLMYSLIRVPTFGVGIARLFGAAIAPARIRAGLNEVFRGNPPSESFVALRSRMWSAPKVAHAVAEESLGAAAELAAQSPRYPEIKRPVYIMGQADDPLRRSSAERLHHDIANSFLRLLSGTGHYLQFEKTADVAAVIRQAIAARPSP